MERRRGKRTREKEKSGIVGQTPAMRTVCGWTVAAQTPTLQERGRGAVRVCIDAAENIEFPREVPSVHEEVSTLQHGGRCSTISMSAPKTPTVH